MKTDVEELSPTRVKLTIEVSFEELKPSLDKAYKELSRQVSLKGFRRGKVPPRLIDQYIGRAPVLEQAVNDAVPELYGKAVQESEIFALGTPEVEVDTLEDGKELVFTAEVDVRPKFKVPEYDGLPVTVDGVSVTADEVEETLHNLRERFATLTNADRSAQTGDFVSIDLAATVEGEDVEDARTSGYSYEIGSGGSVEGLDDELAGMSAGDSKTFTAKLAAGSRKGEEAEVTVTVHSVKVKEMPAIDDEFAQLASEFDTVGELRADTRKRLDQSKRMQQVAQARDRALEALMEKVDIPLPEAVVETEVQRRNEQLDQHLQMFGIAREAYLADQGQSVEDYDAEMEKQAREAVKGGFLLDQLALDEELGVENEELTEYVVAKAMEMRVSPDALAQHLTENNQIPAIVSEVLRTKALSVVVEKIKVTDDEGNEVDIESVTGELEGDAEAAEDTETSEDKS